MWPWNRKLDLPALPRRLRDLDEPRDGMVFLYRVNHRKVVIVGGAGPGAYRVRYEDEGSAGRRFTAMKCNLVGTLR